MENPQRSLSLSLILFPSTVWAVLRGKLSKTHALANCAMSYQYERCTHCSPCLGWGCGLGMCWSQNVRGLSEIWRSLNWAPRFRTNLNVAKGTAFRLDFWDSSVTMQTKDWNNLIRPEHVGLFGNLFLMQTFVKFWSGKALRSANNFVHKWQGCLTDHGKRKMYNISRYDMVQYGMMRCVDYLCNLRSPIHLHSRLTPWWSEKFTWLAAPLTSLLTQVLQQETLKDEQRVVGIPVPQMSKIVFLLGV